MPKKVYDSWVWNKDNQVYDPPTTMPDLSKAYRWDEEGYQADNTKGWVEIDPETGNDI